MELNQKKSQFEIRSKGMWERSSDWHPENDGSLDRTEYEVTDNEGRVISFITRTSLQELRNLFENYNQDGNASKTALTVQLEDFNDSFICGEEYEDAVAFRRIRKNKTILK